MRNKNLDMLLAITCAVLNVVWAFLPYHLPIIGIVLSMPLVFLLPGYLLTQVLSYRRTVDMSYSMTFSIGLSLAITIISGLLLNIIPSGLRATTWAVFLSLFVVACALTVIYLRNKAQIVRTLSGRTSLTFINVFIFGLAAAVIVLSIVYSTFDIAQQPHKTFTQLWVLSVPSSLTKGCAVQIGIQSFEATALTYRVDMNVEGTLTHNWSPISLEPEHHWEQQVPLTIAAESTLHINVHLYQMKEPNNIYRNVSITLHVLKSGNSLHCTN